MKHLRILIACSSLLLIAWASGDVVELEGFLNGRSSANFVGRGNIKFVLDKGTRGEVQEAKALRHGYGLRIKIKTGPRAGEEAWVYYSTSHPALKLYSAPQTEATTVEDAETAEAIIDVPALQTPEQTEEGAIELASQVNTLAHETDMHPDCAIETGPEEVEPETEIAAPPAEEPLAEAVDSAIPREYQISSPLLDGPLSQRNGQGCNANSYITGHRNLEFCRDSDQTYAFTLKNTGSPTINPTGGEVLREWRFEAVEGRRIDAALVLHESSNPGSGASASEMYSRILFFPRTVKPTIKVTTFNGKPAYEVTLPNGEKIIYDKETKEIVSGVVREVAPIDENPNRHARRFAQLAYTGNGIMVRSDQRGESPTSQRPWGSDAGRKVVVTWKGQTCRIAPQDVWEQIPAVEDGRTTTEGSTNLHQNDESFYQTLRTKCNWSVSSANFN